MPVFDEAKATVQLRSAERILAVKKRGVIVVLLRSSWLYRQRDWSADDLVILAYSQSARGVTKVRSFEVLEVSPFNQFIKPSNLRDIFIIDASLIVECTHVIAATHQQDKFNV